MNGGGAPAVIGQPDRAGQGGANGCRDHARLRRQQWSRRRTSGEIVTGYTKILLAEVMPAVEKSYNVSVKQEERAIAGLSMGGAETLYTALNNPDKFAWMGSFSGAFVMWPGGPGRRGGGPGPAQPPAIDDSMFEKNFPKLDAKINSRVRMIWIVVRNCRFTGWREPAVQDVAHVKGRQVHLRRGARRGPRVAALAAEPDYVRAESVPALDEVSGLSF